MENYIRKIINIYITKNKLKTPITKIIFNATFFFFLNITLIPYLIY